MKNLYLSLICSLLMFSMVLGGCSSSTKDANSTQELKEADNEPFTIRISTWVIDESKQYMRDFKENMEKKYKEKYPNATIQWEILLDDTYFDRLTAELSSNTAPDVFFHATTDKFVSEGYLTDLSDQPWATKMHPAVKNWVSINGKVYAASGGMNASGVWYNKKIFADLGLTVPRTWDDFLKILDTVKTANITPIALGFKDKWTVDLILEHMGQSKFYGMDKQFPKMFYDGTKKLDGPEMVSLMERFQLMAEKGYFNKTALSMDWPQSAELFTSGKSAMIIQGGWMPAVAEDNFTKLGHSRFDIGYFAIPDEKGYVNLSISSGEMISVNAKSKLQKQSKDLVAVFLSKEILGPYMIGNGSISAMQDVKLKYPSPALNELVSLLAKVDTDRSWMLYIPESATGSLDEVVTEIVSGAKFKAADLLDAQDKMDKDKAAVHFPAEK